jgi:hypothetical protein
VGSVSAASDRPLVEAYGQRSVELPTLGGGAAVVGYGSPPALEEACPRRCEDLTALVIKRSLPGAYP